MKAVSSNRKAGRRVSLASFAGFVGKAPVCFGLALSLLVCGQIGANAQSWGQYKQLATEASSRNNTEDSVLMWSKAMELSRADNPRGVRHVQSVVGLAQAYCREGKFEQAEPLFKELVELKEAGESGDDLDAGLRDYADKLQNSNRKSEAEELRKKFSLSAAQQEKPLVVAEPNISERWKLLIDKGDREAMSRHVDNAGQYWRQALLLARKQDDHNDMVAESLNRLIRYYYTIRRYDLAEPCYRASLAIVVRQKGTHSLEYLDAVMGHAQLLRKLNRKHEAIIEESKAERTAEMAGLIQPTSGAGGGGGGSYTGGGGGSNEFAFFGGGSSGGSGGHGTPDSYSKGREYGVLMKQMSNFNF